MRTRVLLALLLLPSSALAAEGFQDVRIQAPAFERKFDRAPVEIEHPLMAAPKRKTASYTVAATPRTEIGVARPNAFSVEGLGRGGLYSLNYDRSFTNSFAAGVGLGIWSLNGFLWDTTTVTIVPVYGNYYFYGDRNRFFLTAGADFISADVSDHRSGSLFEGLEEHGSAVAGVVGLGYEFRSPKGFLFRATPYCLFAGGGAMGWLGLSFGGTF